MATARSRVMKRRVFVAGSAAAALALGTAAAQGFPKPSPEDVAPDEPVALADDLQLIDYRFVADNFSVAFLGEIEHLGDEPFDGPPLAVTFLDAGGEPIETIYPIPLYPVIQPGAKVPVSGSFREFNPLEDDWSEVTVAICGDHPKQEFADLAAQVDLRIEDLGEDHEDDAWLAEGVIRNEGEADAESVVVYAIYRNADSRLAGLSRTYLKDPLPAGDEVDFSIGANRETIADPPFDPFTVIGGDYTVELVASIGRPGGYAIEC
jgi:hypothetical protein